MNLYAYCHDNPVNCVDPTGLLGERIADAWNDFYSSNAPDIIAFFDLLAPVSSLESAAINATEATVTATQFQGLSAQEVQAVQSALQKAGINNPNILIQGADMPAGYSGMTLGSEGFAINRSVINDPEELVNTIQHEYQHILDRRALGDSGAYGQSLEDSAKQAENQ